MKFVRMVAQRMGGFAASVVVSAVAGLVAIPLVVHGAGPTAWADLAVGQAAGTIAGVVIAYGWGVFGASRIGAANRSERAALYSSSMRVRFSLFFVAAPVAAAVGAVSALGHGVEAALTAITFSLVGLGAAWYFIGSARPRALLLAETAPRALGTVSGALAAGLAHSLLAYALLQLGGYLAAVIAASYLALRGSGVRAFRSFPSRDASRGSDGWGLVTALCHQVYIAVPTLVASAITPSWLTAYALADRTLRYANNAVQPFGQTLQGWVPAASGGQLHRRMRIAILASSGFGLVCGVGFAVLAPWVAGAVALGTVHVGFDLSVPLGCVIAFSTVSLCTGTSCLVLLGRSRQTAYSAVLGAVLGLPAMVVGASWLGGPGVAWGVVVAEGVSLIFQLVVLARVWRAPTEISDRPAVDAAGPSVAVTS